MHKDFIQCNTHLLIDFRDLITYTVRVSCVLTKVFILPKCKLDSSLFTYAEEWSQDWVLVNRLQKEPDVCVASEIYPPSVSSPSVAGNTYNIQCEFLNSSRIMTACLFVHSLNIFPWLINTFPMCFYQYNLWSFLNKSYLFYYRYYNNTKNNHQIIFCALLIIS